MNCPKCDRVIIGKNEDGIKKLRTRILLFEDDGTKAICPQCKTQVIVPVELQTDDDNSNIGIKHVII